MDGERVGVVLMAYGTPATQADVLPYYTDIRRGRPPTDAQLADLIRRYEAIGGLSPLTRRTEQQRHAVQRCLDLLAPDRYTVALGFKHVSPSIEDAVDELANEGISRIVGAVLAPHYSAYSVGQYVERLDNAAAPHAAETASVASWATLPQFVEFLADDLGARLAAMPERTRVVFTAHSLPTRILDTGDPYPVELRSTAEAVAAKLALVEGEHWELAWQSAGRTPEPWLAPDVLEVVDRLGADPAVDGVVVCACGFVADHLEVLYDLDIEARRRAEASDLAFDRTACVNDDLDVMAGLANLIHEQSVGR